MYIKRKILPKIKEKLSSERAAIIHGPRRVGKTTLVEKILEDYDQEDYIYYKGDDLDAQDILSSQRLRILKENFSGYELLVVDEAQYINNIGMSLKLVVDNIEDIKVIATGSSSFDLQQNVGEPLVGRKFDYTLYPISQIEMMEYENKFEAKKQLENRLIYGTYPEIITTENVKQKKEKLKEIASSYLFKDVLEHEGIKHRKKIVDLLRMVALQIGHEVSKTEIAKKLQISVKLVDKYLDLLEKSYVLINIRGFSRNLRKEITKSSRYYFYDNGVRNALIDNFNDLKSRNDIGQLWENFLVVERLKKQSYTDLHASNYFWRTYDQKEIDWVEQRDGKLYGYEFKWSENKQPKAPKDWVETYDNAEYEVVNRKNYLDFIL